MALDRDKWRDLVKTAVNLRVKKMWGMSSLTEEILLYQENNGSHPIAAGLQCWARLELVWVTVWKHNVLLLLTSYVSCPANFLFYFENCNIRYNIWVGGSSPGGIEIFHTHPDRL